MTEVERPSINRDEGTTLAFSKAQARKLLDTPADDTLAWLRDRAAADPEATAVLYYSGPGAVDKGRYYLIPYDVSLSTIFANALPAREFNAHLRARTSKLVRSVSAVQMRRLRTP